MLNTYSGRTYTIEHFNGLISRGVIKNDSTWIEVDQCDPKLASSVQQRIEQAHNWSGAFRKRLVDNERNNPSDKPGFVMDHDKFGFVRGTMAQWLTAPIHNIFKEVQDLFKQAQVTIPDRFMILYRGNEIEYNMLSPPRLGYANMNIRDWLSNQTNNSIVLNDVTIISYRRPPPYGDDNEPFVAVLNVLPIPVEEVFLQNSPDYPFHPSPPNAILMTSLPWPLEAIIAQAQDDLIEARKAAKDAEWNAAFVDAATRGSGEGPSGISKNAQNAARTASYNVEKAQYILDTLRSQTEGVGVTSWSRESLKARLAAEAASKETELLKEQILPKLTAQQIKVAEEAADRAVGKIYFIQQPSATAAVGPIMLDTFGKPMGSTSGDSFNLNKYRIN
jgi:hypothetical protein